MHDGPEIEELDRRPARAAAEAGEALHRHAEDARLGGRSTTVLRSAAVVALLVGLAVVKPWGAGGGEPADRGTADGTPGVALLGIPTVSSPPSGPPATTPSPTPPPGAVDCGSPDGWRLVMVGWLAGRPAEAHAVVDPVASPSGPADPRIPSLPAGQAPLTGVGACRPEPAPTGEGGPSVPPPVRIAGAWRLEGVGPVPLTVAPKGPAASVTFPRLYGPVGAAAGDWSPGRYVVELIASDLPDPAWIGFDLTAPPSPAP